MPTITLTTPQDIIAAVPYLLGFHPCDSLVVIVAAGRRVAVVFRYDLPDPANNRDPAGDLADHLLAALAQYDADEVALIGYGTARRTRPVLAAAIACLTGLLTIRDALHVTGTRFWSLTCEQCCPPDGIEIDSSATVPAAQLTAGGIAPYPSRQAMLASDTPAPPNRIRLTTTDVGPIPEPPAA